MHQLTISLGVVLYREIGGFGHYELQRDLAPDVESWRGSFLATFPLGCVLHCLDGWLALEYGFRAEDTSAHVCQCPWAFYPLLHKIGCSGVSEKGYALEILHQLCANSA